MFPLYHTVIFHGVCIRLQGWGTTCLFNRKNLIQLTGKGRRRGMVLLIFVANLSQSWSPRGLRRAAVENLFLKLLELLITNMGLWRITDVIPFFDC